MCVLTKSKNKYISTIVLCAKLGTERKMLQQNGIEQKNLSYPNKQNHLPLSIKAISGLHALPLGDDILKREISNHVHTLKQ